MSYSEILNRVPVAKSTLSLWLRSVGLSQRQRQRLTRKKLKAARYGAQIRKERRIAITRALREQSVAEIEKVTGRELWLMGLMLYWAEGSKEKDYNVSQGMIFSNSDPSMIKLWIKWSRECLKVSLDRIAFEIYIHDSYQNRISSVKKYWSTVTGFPLSKFGKIYLKRDNPGTKRKNRGPAYQGLLRVRIRKSTNLNRKIAGWIEGICLQCGVV